MTKVLRQTDLSSVKMVMGHNRLITNGLSDNQPVLRDPLCVMHIVIIVNHDELWPTLKTERKQKIYKEIIAAIAAENLENGVAVEIVSEKILTKCRGVVAFAIALPRLGKLCFLKKWQSLQRQDRRRRLFHFRKVSADRARVYRY